MNELDNIEINEETKVYLREQQSNLVKLIEALAKLENSKEWEVLKTLVFDKSLQGIERMIMSEALAVKINTDKLYKLQGEWVWAKQHSDINKFGETLKKQLEAIKLKLK